jgi:Zn-finger nucleic acid-binding protein
MDCPKCGVKMHLVYVGQNGLKLYKCPRCGWGDADTSELKVSPDDAGEWAAHERMKR